MHFLVKNAPKRDFLAFLKLLGDVVGEECLSPAEACLPLPFPIVLQSLHLIIYRGMLAAIPLSFLHREISRDKQRLISTTNDS